MSKNNFEVGQIVKIGFVSGLRVVEKVATPGDYKPDLYVLHNEDKDRWYSFVPHHGLTRCDSAAEARIW